jgi:hypothetical protein
MILEIFPHVLPLISMLPLFKNTAYTYVAWGWCLLIYFDTRYIQYNLINFVSLNVGFQIMMCMDAVYIKKYLCKWKCLNYTTFFIGHFLVHFLPMYYLYRLYCKVENNRFNDYGANNMICSVLWCMVCNSRSVDMSRIYIDMCKTKWYILWFSSMLSHLLFGYIFTEYKYMICLQ